VCPDVRGFSYDRVVDARLEEAEGLADAIGVDRVQSMIVPVRKVRPATMFGTGQVQNIATACEQDDVQLVIVDGALSPIQQRNLETELQRKVIDRTGLILEIFGERAATAEGRLQVELAHLEYQQSRLVRSWTHLERQRGGYGFLGGPGETQIEADRRLIRQRIARLRKELEQVRRTRALHRQRRGRAPWPVIALVGYMRSVSLPGIEKAILSDTVGFISDLPTQLIAAFRATLEEVTEADLICHVRDISSPETQAERAQVQEILADLGVLADDTGEQPIPILEAWNKIDQLNDEERTEILAAAAADPQVLPISAETGEGVEALIRRCSDILSENAREYWLEVAGADGRKLAWLHEHGEVLEEGDDLPNGDKHLRVRLNAKAYGQFLRT
jgi:GTP-binding protein HflX